MQSKEITTETPKLKIVGNVKVTEIKSVEKEIQLPYYFEKNGDLHKVVSNDFIIRVYPAKKWWGIKVLPTDCFPDEIASGTPITAEEFDAAYQKAMMYVELINRNEEPSREKDENEEIDQILENRVA